MADRASRYITFKASDSKIPDVRVLLSEAVRIVDGFGGWEAEPRPRRTAATIWKGFSPLTLEIPIIFHTYQPNDYVVGKSIEADCIALGMMAGRGEPAPEPRVRNGKVTKVTVKGSGKYASSSAIKKIATQYKIDLEELVELNKKKIPDLKKVRVGTVLTIPQTSTDNPFGEPPTVELIADGSIIPYNDLSVDGNDLQRKQWVLGIDWEDARRNIYGDRIRQRATVTAMQYVSPKLAATKVAPWRRNTKHKKTK